MKKLLLSLLLMPGIAVQAAEPVVPEKCEMPQEIKEADTQFNIEFFKII